MDFTVDPCNKFSLMSGIPMALVSISLAVIPVQVMAQGDYPEKDIKLVVQSSAGGGSDIFARTLVNTINDLELVEGSIIVENRPGGSGSVAYNYTASQAGNPYILQTIASSFFTNPLLGESPTSMDDFTPIASLAKDAYVLTVRSQSDIRDLDDIKEKGQLILATTGVVNDQSILSNILGDELDIETRVLPFNGSGEVTSALLGGHIDAMFGNPSEIIPQIEAGELRAIAVSSEDRLAKLPDTPTFDELGYDIQHSQMRAIVMPNDEPEEVVDYWRDVFQKVSQSDEWQENYLNRFNLESGYEEGENLKQEFQTISQAFEKQMRANGIID